VTTIVICTPIEDCLFRCTHHRALLGHVQVRNRNFHRWTCGLMSRIVRHSITNDISINDRNQGDPNVFTETFSSGHILAPNTIAPKPQAVLHTQPISDESLDSFSSMRYHHANIGTDVSISNLSVDINTYLYISSTTPHSLQVMPWNPPPLALPKVSQTSSMTRGNLRS
jgi:hypothetical protein